MHSTFALSGQHFLFDAHTLASIIQDSGGDTFSYALRDRTTTEVIEDVTCGISEIGVLAKTTRTNEKMERAFDDADLDFVELIQKKPRVVLSASHPLAKEGMLTLDQFEDYPYIFFEQESDAPPFFAEEALALRARKKQVACTDRASLSELIIALDGYTIATGILVGISDGTGLCSIELKTEETIQIGYVIRKNHLLSPLGKRFVSKLEANLKRFSQF